MKELKFRVWDGNKFHYTPKFNMHFSKSGIIAGLDNGSMVFSESNEIQQFTGKIDKNDKEIYEGDILKDDDGFVIKIIWSNEDSAFMYIDVDGDNCFCDCSIYFSYETKIIGNIHENKTK